MYKIWIELETLKIKFLKLNSHYTFVQQKWTKILPWSKNENKKCWYSKINDFDFGLNTINKNDGCHLTKFTLKPKEPWTSWALQMWKHLTNTTFENIFGHGSWQLWKNIYYHKNNTWGKPYEKTMLLQCQHDEQQHGNLQKNSILRFNAMLLKYNV